MFEKSEIRQAVNSIYKVLQNRIMNAYKITDIEEAEEIADKLLKIHGMDRDRFSIIKQIEELIIGKLHENSIDENSNKSEKTIKGILKEASNPIDKIVGYRHLYRKMIEVYGKKEAKRLSGLMYDYTLPISDSLNLMLPYCWVFDASKLVISGKNMGQLQSKPTKRLDSYISLLNEVVHQMSNNMAGAIAIGTFFLDIGHLLLLKEGKTIEDLKNEDYRKYIKNQFQRAIHGFNSLSRGGAVESPFTNISLFDRSKLKKFIEDDYNWYFINDENKFENEYIIEFIMELQNIYMEFFDKGDPMNGGLPYKFPISTINLSRRRYNDKWIIEDESFLKSICKKDIYRYNIFVSEGTKVAACCRLYSNAEMLEYASQANSFGAGGSISIGSHRVISINFARMALLSVDESSFISLIKSATKDCKKVLFSHKRMLLDLVEMNNFIKMGWVQLNRMFSTIGLIGYCEAEEILKNKGIYKAEDDAIKKMLTAVKDTLSNNNEMFEGCFFNTEQIPGESMSHRLAKADKILFGEKDVPYEIYSNQFVPLWNNETSVWEKMKKDGEYIAITTGGGISHINTGEHITSKQAEKIIDYAVECGLEHFAITGTFVKCEDNHVLLGNTEICTKCGKPIIEKFARVVGYWVPVKDMHILKQRHDVEKRKEFKNGDFT